MADEIHILPAFQAFTLSIPAWATGVYCIANTANGKRYVGSAAKSLRRRLRDHRRDLRDGVHTNQILQRAWNKYGETAFEFSVLEYCPPADCVDREQFWLDTYKAADREFGYCIRKLAASQFGTKRSPESIAKMTAKRAGFKHSAEARANMAAGQRGRKLPPEVRAKISAVKSAKRPPEQRFWEHTDKDGPACCGLGKCWVWIGSTDTLGHGQISVNGRLCMVRRYSWTLHGGSDPAGQYVLYRCGNLRCVNPHHLYLAPSRKKLAEVCRG